MEEIILETKNLSVAFNGVSIFDSINFSIKDNEFVSFVGPSGCGKSTLLKTLAGLNPGYSGEITSTAKSPSLMFQEDTLLPWKRCLDNVLLPYALNGEKITPELKEKAIKGLENVGLESFSEYKPNALSGGMKKRVELARVLIKDTDLLILDEPFSNLDIITRERLNFLIKALREQKRMAVLLVTHSIEEAVFLSDKVYLLSAAPAKIEEIFPIEQRADSEGKNYLLSSELIECDRHIREVAQKSWKTNKLPAPLPVENHRKKKSSLTGKTFAPFIAFLLFAAALSLMKYSFNISDLIYPYPHKVIMRFFSTFADGSIVKDLGTTLFESLTGFSIAFALSLFLGYLIAKFSSVARILMPYFIAMHAIPTVAIAPILVIWLGFGYLPRIAVVIIIVFFPALINNIAAVQMADEKIKNLTSFYKPGRWRTFIKLEAPCALPVVFSGVKISITASVVGAVIGEFVSGNNGLGALLLHAQAYYDMELMFVALSWLVILSLAYYVIAVALNHIISDSSGDGLL